MSGNPFKLILKLPGKPKQPDPSPVKARKASKKRKRAEGDAKHAPDSKDHQSHKKSSKAGEEHGEVVRRDVGGSNAERDEMGPGQTVPEGDVDARGQNGASPQPKPIPKLLIRKSFVQKKEHAAGPQGEDPGSPRKKKRKKKKEKQLANGSLDAQGPSNAAASTQPTITSLALPSKALPAKVAKGTLPAKRPVEISNAQPSQPATSTLTLQSNDGPGVTSNLSGLRQHSAGAPGQEANSAASFAGKPRQEDVEILLARLQKKDLHNIFKNPVTDAMAPGYSNVIKRPMSFFQIHASLKDGLYASWEAVQRDLETMFNNAMVFNEPNTHYHQKAREMMGVTRTMMRNIKETGHPDGRRANRGPKNRAVDGLSKQNVIPSAEKRTERRSSAAKAVDQPVRLPKGESKKKIAHRKAQQRALSQGILARPSEDGRGDMGPLNDEEASRKTFAALDAPPSNPFLCWKGLFGGGNAVGMRFRDEHVPHSNFTGTLGLQQYTESLRKFVGDLCPAGQLLVDRKLKAAAQASTPSNPSIQQHKFGSEAPSSPAIPPGTSSRLQQSSNVTLASHSHLPPSIPPAQTALGNAHNPGQFLQHT